MARESRWRSGFEIFLNQRDFYVYTQLLPGAEMIYLKVWSGRTPLRVQLPNQHAYLDPYIIGAILFLSNATPPTVLDLEG